MLELLQGLEREWPDDLRYVINMTKSNCQYSHSRARKWLMRYCWLGNTTGRAGLFSLIDMMQEHNIRDIKVRTDD